MSNVVIIGASSGIGAAAAQYFAEKNHSVYGSYNTRSIENTAINAFELDVTGDINFDHLPESIDHLIYCPGAINLLPFHRIKPADFTADYELQVLGAIKTIQAILPQLKKGTNPSITLFSTVAVQTGFNYHSLVAASKGAIEGLTRSLAAEFAPTIRVNAIAPSLTNTPLASKFINSDAKIEANAKRHPLNKIGEPSNIVSAINYLVNNNWVTSQILTVDGGISGIKL